MKTPLRLPLLLILAAIGACSWSALAAGSAARRGSTSVRASAASTVGARPARAWTERIAAPAQFDLSLARLSFGSRARVARSSAALRSQPRALRLRLRGSAGLYYVAGAVTRFSVVGRPSALVLVVNRRPRGSLAPDLARIGLTVTAPARLGMPLLSQGTNPFTRPSGLTPALCDLPIRGSALTASDLAPVLSSGAAPAGFSAAVAIAQAYDAVCRRPFSASFRQAVTQGSVPPCVAGPATLPACCPPNALCLPPPCPICPCASAPCPLTPATPASSAIACPLASPPVACPLQRQRDRAAEGFGLALESREHATRQETPEKR